MKGIEEAELSLQKEKEKKQEEEVFGHYCFGGCKDKVKVAAPWGNGSDPVYIKNKSTLLHIPPRSSIFPNFLIIVIS